MYTCKAEDVAHNSLVGGWYYIKTFTFFGTAKVYSQITKHYKIGGIERVDTVREDGTVLNGIDFYDVIRSGF